MTFCDKFKTQRIKKIYKTDNSGIDLVIFLQNKKILKFLLTLSFFGNIIFLEQRCSYNGDRICMDTFSAFEKKFINI